MALKVSTVSAAALQLPEEARPAPLTADLLRRAEQRGRSAARRYFADSGFPREVRLDEETLAILLGVAIECGVELREEADRDDARSC